MKIGMVTAVYKPVINGVTRMISQYKQCLDEQGHEVTIFTLGDPDPAGEEANVVRSPAIPIGDYGYQLGVRYTREARERVRLMDILHCHHLVFGVDFAHRYGRAPVVLTNHTRHDLYTSAYLPLPQGAADVLVRQVWPEYAGMADTVIAPSASVRDVMLQFGVTQPIEVIPNGVDLGLFYHPQAPRTKSDLGIPDAALLAVYTGRLADEKNLEILLQQFSLAVDIIPEMHLLLVGHGPAKDDLDFLARKLGLADRVHMIGAVEYRQMPDVLAAADFYVTASVTEVHPLALIEAMAVGLPVAASRSPGIIDIVEHGVTGFLTSDPENGLCAAIVALVINWELRSRMGENARQASRDYDINHTVARTVDLYNRLLAERPDLQREHKHGRWYRPQSKIKPRLKDIARKIGLDDDHTAYLDGPGDDD